MGMKLDVRSDDGRLIEVWCSELECLEESELPGRLGGELYVVYDYTVKVAFGPASVRLFGDIGRAIEFAHGFTDLRVPVLKSVRRDDGIFGWDAVYSVL